MARSLEAADLFCGAGGTSIGAEQSGAAKVRFAVNHWDVAVQTHAANFPGAKHINSRLDQVKPGECPRINLLFASPECTHHSRARGGRPTSDQQRAGAWELLPWLHHHRPAFMVVENVVEFQEWGPVGENGRPLQKYKGRLFSAWLQAIQAEGYTVDYARLNAADFGAATSRERLFVIARKGNRSPVFPDPTHARNPGRALPGLQRLPWRAAAEIIDWGIPCPSIFARVRPLADKTLARIEAGLRRFVEPFVVTLRSTTGAMGTGGTVRDLHGEPIGTLTTGRNHAIAVPFTAQWDNQTGGGSYSRPVDGPLATFVTKANQGLCMPLVMSTLGGGVARDAGQPGPTITAHGGMNFIVPYLGEAPGQAPRTHALGDVLPAVTASNPKGLAVPYISFAKHGDLRTADLQKPLGTITGKNGAGVAVPFLCQHYSSGGQWSGIDSPVPTIPTVDRHGLTIATIDPCCLAWPAPHSDAMASLQRTMRELGVADIGFRMLQNHELAAAQGFPASYIFHGNKSQVTRQIGNSVSPDVARAITEALAA